MEEQQLGKAEEPPNAIAEVGRLTAALKLRPEPAEARSPNKAGEDGGGAQMSVLNSSKAAVAKKAPDVPEGSRWDETVTPHRGKSAPVKRSKRKTACEVEGSPAKLSNGAKRPIATRQRVGTRLAVDTRKAVGREVGRRGNGADVSMSPGASPPEEDGVTKPSAVRVSPGMTTPTSHISARNDKLAAPATDPPRKSIANISRLGSKPSDSHAASCCTALTPIVESRKTSPEVLITECYELVMQPVCRLWVTLFSESMHRVAKGNGVMETLQILDFQQGLVPSSAANPKRFPAIVDYSTERKNRGAAGPSKASRKSFEPSKFSVPCLNDSRALIAFCKESR